MIEEKVECKRLGYEYKNLFAKLTYFIHHTPFAKDFISDNDLKMLSDLDLFLNTGKYEIIEFGTHKTRFDSSDIIQTQKEEIERLNNIIKSKEVNYNYLKLLFEKKDKEEVIKSYVYKCEQLEKLYKSYEEKEIEVMKKDNIIDELEKYHIKSMENLENTEDFKYVGTNHIKILYEEHKRTLDKLKELKEGK